MLTNQGIEYEIPISDLPEGSPSKQFNMYSGSEIKELEEQVRELKTQISQQDKKISKLSSELEVAGEGLKAAKLESIERQTERDHFQLRCESLAQLCMREGILIPEEELAQQEQSVASLVE